MTTIGYGDMYPTSIWGKIFASGAALWGVMLVAIPVGIFGSNFSKIYSEEENKARIRKGVKAKKLTKHQLQK
jgi:hypothetical protein